MSEEKIRKAQGRRLGIARQEAGYRSAREAALENGWPESSYRAHENGTRTIGLDDAERYARRFRLKNVDVEASTILFGGDDDKPASPQGIRLVGHVGADSRPDVGIFTDVQGDLDDDIPIPPDRTPTTVAVVVRGNSMRSIARDGWLLYFNEADIRVGPLSFAGLYGELCICWLIDGRVLFKELHKGKRPDLSYLTSSNDDPIPDVMVERAVRVTFIAPRGPRPKTDQIVSNDDAPRANRKA